MKSILDSSVISRLISRESILNFEKFFDIWVEKAGVEKFLEFPDHFAIKVETESELHNLVEEFKIFCVDKKGETPGLSIRKMHGRKVAVALLAEPILFKNKKIDCIEIMQQRPEEVGNDIVGIGHLEYVVDSIDEVEKVYIENGIKYYHDRTNNYKKVMVTIVDGNQLRVKFTNRTLEAIVPEQIRDEPERVEIIK